MKVGSANIDSQTRNMGSIFSKINYNENTNGIVRLNKMQFLEVNSHWIHWQKSGLRNSLEKVYYQKSKHFRLKLNIGSTMAISVKGIDRKWQGITD
jgi:hypothetical protein